MSMKIVFRVTIATMIMVGNFADTYNKKIISYSGYLADVRFFGDKCVFCACNDNLSVEEVTCTFYRMNIVDEQFGKMKTCTITVPRFLQMYALDPLGPDHVYAQLELRHFIAVNLTDCRYVQSKFAGNYTGDLATIGVSLEQVFSGGLQIFYEKSEGERRGIYWYLGFDSQGNQFGGNLGQLNPQHKEALEEYQKNHKLKYYYNLDGFYMYDRDQRWRKFQRTSNDYVPMIFGKSNNLISNYGCEESLGSNYCDYYINQYDLNGKLKLSYDLPAPNISQKIESIYNLPGGGFLLLTVSSRKSAVNNSRFGHLTEVDANGRLIAERQRFIEADMYGFEREFNRVYRNDDNESCVIYGEDFRTIEQLHISVKCTGPESSTLSHGWYILFICLLVILCACLLAWLLHIYTALPRLWSYLTCRRAGSNSENSS